MPENTQPIVILSMENMLKDEIKDVTLAKGQLILALKDAAERIEKRNNDGVWPQDIIQQDKESRDKNKVVSFKCLKDDKTARIMYTMLDDNGNKMYSLIQENEGKFKTKDYFLIVYDKKTQEDNKEGEDKPQTYKWFDLSYYDNVDNTRDKGNSLNVSSMFMDLLKQQEKVKVAIIQRATTVQKGNGLQ